MTFHPSRLALLLMLSFPAFAAAGHSGIELDHFDRKVRIQDDLFQAVNGNWIKTTEIPANRSSLGSFQEINSLAAQRNNDLIDAAIVQPDSPEARQMAALYRSFMDQARIDRLGFQPVKPLLAEIGAVNDRKALSRLLGSLPARGIAGPLRPYVNIDDLDPANYVVMANQSGLGLPDRDYYLQDKDGYREARAAYLSYMETLLRQAGLSDPARRARAVLALETRLAQSQWDNMALRDPYKSHNKFDRAGLAKTTPRFDWASFLDGAEMGAVQVVDIRVPSYADALGGLLASESMDAWRDYLRVRLLDDTAPLLSQSFVAAHSAFHDKALSGRNGKASRRNDALQLVGEALSDSVGKRYVAKYFPAEAKAKLETLVGNVLKAYGQSIDQIEWMGPATKIAAKDKLAKYRAMVGYPNKWRDYGGLDLRADDLVGNRLRINQFDYRYKLAKLGRPVDREEWERPPQEAVAYYDAPLNVIVFPAAMLQPPFYKPGADDAVNYGTIGTIIAHEISHGFDDLGGQYDGDGNLRDWWQAEDRQRFKALAGRLVTQFNGYEALPKHFVNGEMTVGENIADLSGLQIAYKAYQLSLNGKPSETLDGFSGEQRFFIAYGQLWRSKVREQRLLSNLSNDWHAPNNFRAIGPVMNSDAFHQAFGTKPGDGMFKPEAERIRIW